MYYGCYVCMCSNKKHMLYIQWGPNVRALVKMHVTFIVNNIKNILTEAWFCCHRAPWWRNGSWLEFTVDSSFHWRTPSRPKQSCVW